MSNQFQRDTVRENLSRLRSKFEEWISLPDYDVIDFLCAVVIANRTKDIPIWVFLVAPPSSGKTELLMSFKDVPEAITISKFTPRTLLSGYGGEESSLLKRMDKDGKTLMVFKDFTTVLEMDHNARAEIISQLREVADGRLDVQTGGPKGNISWEGHVGMLAGVTGAIDMAYAIKNSLGSRFFYYRLPIQDHMISSRRALLNSGLNHDMKNQLRGAVSEFFSTSTFENALDVPISDELSQKIANMAVYVAHVRCDVARDGYTRIIQVMPEPEGSPRLMQQFIVMAKALASVRGKEAVTEDELRVVAKIANDTAPRRRTIALKHLYGLLQVESERTRDIAVACETPTNTMKETLEDLCLVGCVDKTLEDGGEDGNAFAGSRDSTPYLWKIKSGFREIIAESGIFGGTVGPTVNGGVPTPVPGDLPGSTESAGPTARGADTTTGGGTDGVVANAEPVQPLRPEQPVLEQQHAPEPRRRSHGNFDDLVNDEVPF